MSAHDSHGMTAHADHDDGEVHVHALSVGLLLKVFLSLAALTVLTVLTGKADLHGLDLGVALIIATVKASLVCLFFMHLKYDKPFHGMIFLFSVMFVGLFLAFVSLDKGQYEKDARARVADEHIAAEQADG